MVESVHRLGTQPRLTKEIDNMANQEFILKGRCGAVRYGYIQEQGQRNQWVIQDADGKFWLARENNMSAAFKDACALDDEIKAA